MNDNEDRRDGNKNKLTPEDKINQGTNSTMGNLSGHLTPRINSHSKIPEGAKTPHSEIQIQPALQKEKIILVADDDDFNFFVIESLLTPFNYRVIHARDGEEAVRIFRSKKEISLILMDIQMPIMDGLTATKEIRKIDKKVPVIAQTSYRVDKIKEMAFNSGCNDFLTKPINSDLLIHKIQNYIKN